MQPQTVDILQGSGLLVCVHADSARLGHYRLNNEYLFPKQQVSICHGFSSIFWRRGVFLATAARGADSPNILYIMSDDHAAHAISAYQGRLAEIAPTPNLDRIAHEERLVF